MENISRPLPPPLCARTAYAALCGFACLCLCIPAQPDQAYAATRAKAQSETRPVKKTGGKDRKKPGWDFHETDKSALNARWKESISVTLRKTTFAPSAPAGRYLQRSKDTANALPPAQIADLDKIPPQGPKKIVFGDTEPPISGEFTQESIGWRPDTPLNAPMNEFSGPGSERALKEERQAGAYADFHPGEDIELKLGPEYHFSSQALRPDQTGRVRDAPGSLGMGMKLKMDF